MNTRRVRKRSPLFARSLIATCDAGIETLSADRRFATAYNAALQLSKVALAAAGYRLSKGHGGHERAFDVVRYIVRTEEIEDLCDYFDTCRRKRNDIDYDFADVVTDTELEEILSKVSEYRDVIEGWLKKIVQISPMVDFCTKSGLFLHQHRRNEPPGI